MGLPFDPSHFSHCCDSPYSDTFILYPVPVQAGCPHRVVGVLMILGSSWLCVPLKKGHAHINSTQPGNPPPFVCPTFHLSHSHSHPSAVPYLYSAFWPGSSSTCVPFCIRFGISASTSVLTPTFCPCFIFLILFLESILSLSYVFPFSSL